MTAQTAFAFEPASDDVRHERDGAWFVARPVTPAKTGYVIVSASCSKISFADAERLLRRLLAANSQ